MTDFPTWWSCWPRKDSRKDAEKAWGQVTKMGHIPEQIIAGTKAYVLYWKDKGTDRTFIPLPASFLRGLRWQDECIAGRIEANSNAPLLALQTPSWGGLEKSFIEAMGRNGHTIFCAWFSDTTYENGIIWVKDSKRRNTILDKFEHKLHDRNIKVEVRRA